MAYTDRRSGQTSEDSYAIVWQDIKNDRSRPCYLLYGDEPFLIRDLIEKSKRYLIHEAALSVDFQRYDGDGNASKINWSKLKGELMTPAMFSRKRLFLIRNSAAFKSPLGLSQAEEEDFMFCISRADDQSCLLFWEDKIDKRLQKPLKALQINGYAAEINKLNADRLIDWLAAYFLRYEIKIARQAASELVDRCESDMFSLQQEAQKLRLYCQERRQHAIHQDTIEWVARADLRGSIFKLSDALATARADEALKIYRRLRYNKEATQYILFMLARHLRQLICARDLPQASTLVSLLKVQNFVAQRLIKQSQRFSAARLTRMYTECQANDILIKSGKMDEDLALETLILDLAREF